MKVVRCSKCKTRLLDENIKSGSISIKCRKCNTITTINKPFQDRLNLNKK